MKMEWHDELAFLFFLENEHCELSASKRIVASNWGVRGEYEVYIQK